MDDEENALKKFAEPERDSRNGMIPWKGSGLKRLPYRIVNRQGGGAQIQQGKSYIMLSRDEIPGLINDLRSVLARPARADEINIGQEEA